MKTDLSTKGLLERLGLHRRELRAWAMYDWANSAFVLIVVTAVFPIFYKNVTASELPGEKATEYYGWVTTGVLLAVALLAPVTGAIADFLGWRKRFLTFAVFLGVVPTACMVLLHRGDWVLALALFALGNLGVSSSFIFYDSLLPHVAKGDEIDRVSAGGYALGYLGSGLLLILNLSWIQFPGFWGIADAESATRLSFFSVAVWWLLFSIPILRSVKEPARRLEAGEQTSFDAVRVGLRRLTSTFHQFRGSYRQAFVLLIAVLVYNDGIGTIIRMAALYASSRGLPDSDVILAILMVQFVGVPCSLLFGSLAGALGTKRAILAGLSVYTLATLIAYNMETIGEFYVLALLIGLVQGGTQALSRSLFASMIPHHRTSEFFGFYSVSEKVAGIFGPMVFSLMISLTGSTQPAVLSLIVFFVAGAVLLLLVDEQKGREEAQRIEERTL
jgi:UMF1 family MFS transporter